MSTEAPTEPVVKEPETWTPPATEEEFEKILGNRVYRERAKYADYEDFKAKATEFDKAQEASKSDIEKASARAEKAEKELEAVRLESVRSSVALAKSLTPTQAKRLVGTTREELEADADELLADLKPAEQRTNTLKKAPASGASSGRVTDDRAGDRALARDLFGKRD